MQIEPGKEWVIGVMALLFLAAVIYIWFFRKDRFTEYARMCECEYGFTPNPHDGRCAVCRGWER